MAKASNPAGTKGETWKKVYLASSYEVSDKGQVRKKVGQRILKPTINENGRKYIVIIGDDGKRKNVTVGSLVLRAFVGAPKAKANRAIHGAGGMSCDYITNLRYGTMSEQVAAARAVNPVDYSARHGIDQKTARACEKRLKKGGPGNSLQAISKELGVARSTLTHAIRRLHTASPATAA